MREKILKNKKILIIGAIILVCGLSISYGFLTHHLDLNKISNFKFRIPDVERFNINVGSDIGLTANENNFGTGSSNLSATSTSTVSLKAKEEANSTASKNYYAYVYIANNNFEYTVDSSTPEVILTVTDPNGNAVTSLSGLTYYSNYNGVSGFDITNKVGLYQLANNRSITSNSYENYTTDNWTVTVTLVALSTDQSDNLNKNMSVKVYVSENALAPAATLAKLKVSSNKIFNVTQNYNADLTNETSGIYQVEDNDGLSYVYAGYINYNWVSFAGFYWRIVRITGDGSIRMIYSGEAAPTSSNEYQITGSGTSIGRYIFNSTSNKAEYVGYMYTIDSGHGNSNDSYVKTIIDTWYTNNILNQTNSNSKSYDTFTSQSSYCYDRETYSGTIDSTTYSGNGVGTSDTLFMPARRLIASATNQGIGTGPSLICTNQNDIYKLKIGLLSADEAAVAGFKCDDRSDGGGYYLNSGINYWLGSPVAYNEGYSVNFAVYDDGFIYSKWTGDELHVRPVINISPNVTISGSGLYNAPYTIS